MRKGWRTMKSEGWMDLQVNGYAGVDFNAPGLTVEAVKSVTERLEADGTCGYMPTLVTGVTVSLGHHLATAPSI